MKTVLSIILVYLLQFNCIPAWSFHTSHNLYNVASDLTDRSWLQSRICEITHHSHNMYLKDFHGKFFILYAELNPESILHRAINYVCSCQKKGSLWKIKHFKFTFKLSSLMLFSISRQLFWNTQITIKAYNWPNTQNFILL